MPPRPPEICDASGKPIPLGPELGRGGEGTVFDLSPAADLVAKVYHAPLTPERASKIRFMATQRSDELLHLTAWPTALISTKQGQRPIGLIMPKVSGKKDIHRLYSVKSRRSDFQRADWRFLMRTASNISRAFIAIHKLGFVIGDVNHGSILVGQDATVSLIDCDSFQISNGHAQYFCDKGVDTYTAPELQGKSFVGLVRIPNHDNFGLAVMIFLTLFMGRHPFAGLYSGGDMPIARAIAEYRFAYGANSRQFGITKPPGAASLDIVGPTVARLFERAFSHEGSRGNRPSALEWVDALSALETELQQCSANSSHWFRKGQPCPWCPIEEATGIGLFSIVLQGTPGGAIEIEALWRQANAIVHPGPTPTIKSPVVESDPEAAEVRAFARNSKLVAGGIAALIAGLALFGGLDAPLPAYLLVGGVAAYFSISKFFGKTGQIAEYRRVLDGATKSWFAARQEWEAKAGPASFDGARARLSTIRQHWDNLASIRLRKLDQLKRDQAKIQLERYLDSFELEKAKIEGIGSGRKQLLASYGIETAADVSKASAVPGFGPVLFGRLMDWRATLEGRFRFDPKKGIDPRDIAKIEQEILTERKRLEDQMRVGIAQLQQASSQISNARKYMRAKVEELQLAYYQAYANANGKSP